MIEFREQDEREEWAQVHPVLKEIVQWAHDNLWPMGRPFVITSIWRTVAENTAAGAKTLIHTVGPPYRAVDVGDRPLTAVELIVALATVNKRWIYDPTRPNIPVAYGQPHGTGPHIHFQVHQSTRLTT